MDREKHCMVGPHYQVEIPQQVDLNEGDSFFGTFHYYIAYSSS